MTNFKDVQLTRKQRKLLEFIPLCGDFAQSDYAMLERYSFIQRCGKGYERLPNGEEYLIFYKRERWYNLRLWLALGVSFGSLAVAVISLGLQVAR